MTRRVRVGPDDPPPGLPKTHSGWVVIDEAPFAVQRIELRDGLLWVVAQSLRQGIGPKEELEWPMRLYGPDAKLVVGTDRYLVGWPDADGWVTLQVSIHLVTGYQEH